jgi:hypothetical protein
MFATAQPEKADLDAVRRYAESVIVQSEGEDLQMKAITLALLGAIMWRSEPGSTTMRDSDGANAVLSTTLGGRRLTFSYNQHTESIAMREEQVDGPVLHSFCNRTLVKDFEQTFRNLWR